MADLVTNNRMNDAERIAAWGKVDTLEIAVAEFLEHSSFVGDDPYYRDLDEALWAMLRRSHEARVAR